MAYPLPWGERVRVRENYLIITPTLILPHQGGGKFFRELDASQLCCGVLHFDIFFERSPKYIRRSSLVAATVKYIAR
jgi:hypothetical protein